MMTLGQLIVWFLAFASLGTFVAGSEVQVRGVAVLGGVENGGFFDFVDDESLGDLINRIGGLPVHDSDLQRYDKGERIRSIRLVLWRRGEDGIYSRHQTYRLDPKTTSIWTKTLQKGDIVEVVKSEFFRKERFTKRILLKKKEVSDGQALNSEKKKVDVDSNAKATLESSQ